MAVHIALWLPTLVFAHVFASVWLIKLLILIRPALLHQWHQLLGHVSQHFSPQQDETNGNAHAMGAVKAHAVSARTAVVLRRPSHEAFCPCTLEWRNIGCSYQTSTGTAVVLQQVFGSADPGTLHALLGPSGAGKSSLLDILAQRKRIGRLTGRVLLDGKPVNPAKLVERSAYVPQEDNFMPVMTAMETLRFYAAMRLPQGLTAAERDVRARDALQVLGLAQCATTLVGGQLPGGLSLRGLSGGERKRLAIAVGLLGAPSLLFLDEPTSGLDSFAALTIMKYIRSMADDAGHAVIASIHQPRSDIWAMFDTVTILSQGLMIYTGPRNDMVPWFTQGLPRAFTDYLQPAADHIPAAYKDDEWHDTPCRVALPSSHAASDLSVCVSDDSQPQGDVHHVVLDILPSTSTTSDSNSDTSSPQTASTHEKDNALATHNDGGVCNSPAVLPTRRSLRDIRFQYNPELHGVAADWVMDIVALGFNTTAAVQAESRQDVTKHSNVFIHMSELQAAAAAFLQHHMQQPSTANRITAIPAGKAASQTAVKPSAQTAFVSLSRFTGLHMEHEVRRRTYSHPSRSGELQAVTIDEDKASAVMQSVQRSFTLTVMSHFHSGNSEIQPIPYGYDDVLSELAKSVAFSIAPDTSFHKSSWKPICRKPTPMPDNSLLCPWRGQRIREHASSKNNSNSHGDHGPACVMQVAGIKQRFRALLWREMTCMTRNPADVAGRMLNFAWIAILAGLVFYSIPEGVRSVQLRLNVHFSNTAFFLLMPYISMSLYSADRQFFLADASSRLYHPLSYYIAKVVATLPFHALASLVYCLIIQGMTGLRYGSVPVVQATAITTMVSLIAVQVLHTAAALAPNQDTAFMLSISWTAINLLMSGFFITYQQFAFHWLSQLRWLSAQGYAFEGLARIELQGMVYDCSEGLTASEMDVLSMAFPSTPLLHSALVRTALQQPGPGCQVHADAILQYYGLRRPFSKTLGILLGYWAVVHILTYRALVFASRRERR